MPVINQTRVKTRFLLFPKAIGGVAKWLEKASWEETFVPDGDAKLAATVRVKGEPYGWIPTRWL